MSYLATREVGPLRAKRMLDRAVHSETHLLS